MFTRAPIRLETDFHGQKLSLETGLLAQQATSSVLATIGETSVLAAVVVGKDKEGDYFPLQVVYEERLYASGKIKGSRFIKREGRPSDNAILTGRMIDRSLRSLFDPKIRSEVQVIITVLSLDEVNPPDTLGVLVASAALSLATSDFQGPVSSVRIGQVSLSTEQILLQTFHKQFQASETFETLQDILVDLSLYLDLKEEMEKSTFREIFETLGHKNPEWAENLKKLYSATDRNKSLIQAKYPSQIQNIPNPNYEQISHSALDLVVSGNGQNVVMLEAGAQIIPEEGFAECLDLAAKELTTLTNFQEQFLTEAKTKSAKIPKILGKQALESKYLAYWQQYKRELEEVLFKSGSKEDKAKYLQEFKADHYDNVETLEKLAKQEGLTTLNQIDVSENSILKNLLALLEDLNQLQTLNNKLEIALEDLIYELVKENVLQKDRRLDGRKLDETRKITCDVNVLPRTHGSSLFQRGETQVLNILTLGTTRDAQLLDDMEDFEEQTKRYIHHYNFPAYSVGETGRYSGPGRREIGHGALAEKALLPVLPSEEEFPYTIRLVSECLGSNGSTSMASTCASCLSLMQGGVPLKDMVAGVAMGLILDQQTRNFKVLTDIQGAEDKYGDMDFKVTGTKDGITAIQLDNKVAGLTVEILKQALVAAKAGRLHILGIMQQAISKPNAEISPYAPRVLTLNIPIEKIGDVIGPSGKIIKSLVQRYEVEIDIEDLTGKASIFGRDMQKVREVVEVIKTLIKDYKIGEVASCKIFRLESFGAICKLDGTEREGMIHISQISKDRVNKIGDYLKIGQVVSAKVSEINEKGQIGLSMKD